MSSLLLHHVVGWPFAEERRSAHRAVERLLSRVALHKRESQVAVESLSVSDGGEIEVQIVAFQVFGSLGVFEEWVFG